jgi:hypothetical protein
VIVLDNVPILKNARVVVHFLDESAEEEAERQWREAMERLQGSCIDPTMVEPPDIPPEYDIPRRYDLI